MSLRINEGMHHHLMHELVQKSAPFTALYEPANMEDISDMQGSASTWVIAGVDTCTDGCPHAGSPLCLLDHTSHIVSMLRFDPLEQVVLASLCPKASPIDSN